jgi:hypothetical protein
MNSTAHWNLSQQKGLWTTRSGGHGSSFTTFQPRPGTSCFLATYFAKCLTNEGKLKHPCEFQEKFPEVLHFLQIFLRLKIRFRVSGGSAKFRVLNSESMEFGAPWAYSSNKRMSLALMDLCDTPGHSVADDYTKQPRFGLLLATLRGLRNPSISTPAIWIWIVNLENRLAQAKEYAT